MAGPTDSWIQPYLPASIPGQANTGISGVANMSSPGQSSVAPEQYAQLNIVPWGTLNGPQAQVQLERLIRAYQEMQQVIAQNQLSEEQRRYLEQTPYDELPDHWKQRVNEIAAAERYLPVVESAINQGRQVVQKYQEPTIGGAFGEPIGAAWARTGLALAGRADASRAPDVSWKPQQQGGGTEAGAIEPVTVPSSDPYLSGGASSNPLAGEIDLGGLTDEMGYTPEQIARYNENVLVGQELDNAYRQAQIAEMSGSPEDKMLSRINLVQAWRNFQNAPKDRAEEMRRYNQEWAAQQAARAYSQWIQRKQLESQLADNYNAMQSNSWQFIANNALPAGMGYVPGFGPDSRLAQVMGPSFTGLPTVTLETPSPTTGYDWAAQYLGGR